MTRDAFEALSLDERAKLEEVVTAEGEVLKSRDGEQGGTKAQGDEVNQAPAEAPAPVKLFTPEEVQQIIDNNGPKVMVVFDYIRQDATKGTERAFLNRMRDILTVQDIFEIEKGLVEQSKGTLVRVLITNWKALQA
jgi:hypothetical protein